MKSDVDYARVKGPPKDWTRLAVFDAASGQQIHGVIEANAAEGWFIRIVRDAEGKIVRDGPERRTERVEAEILIQRTFGCGAPIRPPEGWTPSQRFTPTEDAT